MRKILVLVGALVSFAAVANAGVVRESFKVSKFAAKKSAPVILPVAKFVSYPERHPKKSVRKAAHYSVKAGKVAGKVLY